MIRLKISCLPSAPLKYIMIMSQLVQLQLRTLNCRNYRQLNFPQQKVQKKIVMKIFKISSCSQMTCAALGSKLPPSSNSLNPTPFYSLSFLLFGRCIFSRVQCILSIQGWSEVKTVKNDNVIYEQPLKWCYLLQERIEKKVLNWWPPPPTFTMQKWIFAL